MKPILKILQIPLILLILVQTISCGNHNLFGNDDYEGEGDYGYSSSVYGGGSSSSRQSSGSGAKADCPAFDAETHFCDNRDGKIYRWVKIGEQTWMAENLSHAVPTRSWCYENKEENCALYGRLYDWYAAMDFSNATSKDPSGVKGVCPEGWHLPSNAEGVKLLNSIGDQPKELISANWVNDYYANRLSHMSYIPIYFDGDYNDSYGFSALSSGLRRPGGDFENKGACWWLTDQGRAETTARFFVNLCGSATSGTHNHIDKYTGFSVRCVRD
jgi:uncharacterized protein (TIGR02145 family)